MITLKKHIKVVILLSMLFNYCSVTSQEKVSIGFYQDARLLLLGDNHSNPRGTIDIIFNLQFQSSQKKHGYFIFFPEFENANISGSSLKRYSLSAGFTFNKLQLLHRYLKKFEATSTIGFGVLDRFGTTTNNWSMNANLVYKINDRIKLGFNNQFMQRTDLRFKYQKDVIRHSFHFGIKVNLFKLK